MNKTHPKILNGISPFRGLIEVCATSPAIRWIAGLGGVAILAILGTYHQPFYPSTWLDEGFVLQGAINLVRFGQYAMRSVEGFRVLDQPLIANGPGVVIPIAASFAVLGVGLWQARLVSVLFLILTGIVFFLVAKRLYGPAAALISSFFLVALPQEGFLLFGRQALGNVPTIGYFLAGYYLWVVSLEKHSSKLAFGAGVLFGLSMVTKGQYGLLVPVLLAVGLADRLFSRQIGVRNITIVLATALACLAIWNGIQLMLVGWDGYVQNLNAVRASSQVTVFAFRITRAPGNLWYLITSGILLLIGPGAIYVAQSFRKDTSNGGHQLFLLVFMLIWALWYVFASVGWHRYALDIYVIGALFSGKFVLDSISSIFTPKRFTGAKYRSERLFRGIAILLVAASFVYGIWSLTLQIQVIGATPDESPQRLAQFLQANISSRATIESWEWEIDALTNLTYHHPSNDWVDKYTTVLQFHDKLSDSYDPFAYKPDYLIDGPFSKWTGIYNRYLDNCCSLITREGPYDMYKVKPGQGH